MFDKEKIDGILKAVGIVGLILAIVFFARGFQPLGWVALALMMTAVGFGT